MKFLARYKNYAYDKTGAFFVEAKNLSEARDKAQYRAENDPNRMTEITSVVPAAVKRAKRAAKKKSAYCSKCRGPHRPRHGAAPKARGGKRAKTPIEKFGYGKWK